MQSGPPLRGPRYSADREADFDAAPRSRPAARPRGAKPCRERLGLVLEVDELRLRMASIETRAPLPSSGGGRSPLLDELRLLGHGDALMAYMLFMVEPVGQRQARTEVEGREAYASMVRWAEDLKKRGLLIAAESLRSQASASRVKLRGGRPQITDGPFSEAKEMIGGFFLINCATPQEALAVASECPAAAWLTVEVRGVAACFEESLAGASGPRPLDPMVPV